MRIAYSEAQEELRRELRGYFEKLMTPQRRAALTSSDGEIGEGDAYRDVVRQMGADGWLALGWPEEFGGANRSMMDQLIFTDEAAIAGAPVPFLTINSVAPTIMAFGTEDQKKFFLPRIAAGDLHDDRIRLAAMVGAAQAFFGGPQRGVGGQHLAHRHAGAHAFAQHAKRPVGHPGHRGHDQAVLEGVRANLHAENSMRCARKGRAF